jgi:hypothetical protein
MLVRPTVLKHDSISGLQLLAEPVMDGRGRKVFHYSLASPHNRRLPHHLCPSNPMDPAAWRNAFIVAQGWLRTHPPARFAMPATNRYR